MHRRLKELTGFHLQAEDGLIGSVDEIYFDDAEWVIRYFVVDTGKWLPGKKVLIAPSLLGSPQMQNAIVPVRLTREQVRQSPDRETEKPVSRVEAEQSLYASGVPSLWAGSDFVVGPPFPLAAPAIVPMSPEPDVEPAPEPAGPRLRSSSEVTGYTIRASDGEAGKVRDFVFDDGTWRIDYLIVDAGSLLSPKPVLIERALISDVRWAAKEVVVDLDAEDVRERPEYQAGGSGALGG